MPDENYADAQMRSLAVTLSSFKKALVASGFGAAEAQEMTVQFMITSMMKGKQQ